MYCRHCGKPLPPRAPYSRRQYCDDACKQAHYRQLHRMSLEKELQAAEARIAELEAEVAELRRQLSVDERYYIDTTARPFKSWLGRNVTSPFARKISASAGVPVRGSRSWYEAYLRRNHCTDDEMAEFVALWKRMLLDQ